MNSSRLNNSASTQPHSQAIQQYHDHSNKAFRSSNSSFVQDANMAATSTTRNFNETYNHNNYSNVLPANEDMIFNDKSENSIEECVKHLERSGPKPSAHDVVPCLKNMLQASCSSTWNNGQILRLSEWTMSMFQTFVVSGVSLSNQHDAQSTNLITICTFAAMSLYQLMEMHWDDLQIYSSMMTCNDDAVLLTKEMKENYDSKSRILLEVLRDVVCSCYCREVFNSSILHASVTAFATAWKSLHRIHRIITANNTSTLNRAHDTFWWISQHESTQITENWILQITNIVGKALLLSTDDWQCQQQNALSLSTGLQLCEYKTACASILINFLETRTFYEAYSNQNYLEDYSHCISKVDWIAVQQQLLQESLRLNDSNMPASAYAIWSLTSFQLLTVLNANGIDPPLVSTCCGNPMQVCDNSMIDLEFKLSDEYKRLLQSSDIVDHIVRGTFWTSGINLAEDSPRPKPRWTQQAESNIVQQSFATLQTIYRFSPVLIGNCIAHHPMAQHFLSTQWANLLRKQTNYPHEGSNSKAHTHRFSQLLFMWNNCRYATRDALCRILKSYQNGKVNQEKYIGNDDHQIQLEFFRHLLLQLLETPKRQTSYSVVAISAIALVKALLEDGLILIQDDLLSRQIWGSVNQSFLEKCAELIIGATASASRKNSSVQDYSRPLLVCLLDLASVVSRRQSSHDNDDYSMIEPLASMISLYPTESVESIIGLLVPCDACTQKAIVPDAIEADKSMLSILEESYRSVDSEDTTPPSTNLPRKQQHHNIDYSRDDQLNNDEMKNSKSKGVDPILGLAAAIFLAELGSKSKNDLYNGSTLSQGVKTKPENERVLLLRRRMLEAANKFVFDRQLTFCSMGKFQDCTSFDATRRRLIILNLLSTNENHDHLSLLLYSAEVYQMTKIGEETLLAHKYKVELQQSRTKFDKMKENTEILQEKLNLLSLRSQREKIELQQALVQNNKHQVEIHIIERTKAEARAQDLSKRVLEVENLLSDADRSVRECRESEKTLRSSLEQTTSKLQVITSREQNLMEKNEKMEKDLMRAKNELKSIQSLASDIQSKERLMQEKINLQTFALTAVQKNENQLQESLEHLFGDMCCLAHIYEIKEREAIEHKECAELATEKLKHRLDSERRQNFEMEDRLKRIQYENEMLSKKYAKVREKLEEERDDRRRENERRKRAAPISYINQLHRNQSTSGMDSTTESQQFKSSQKNPSVRTHSDNKENSTSSSSIRINSSSNNNNSTRTKSTSSHNRY